MHPKLTNPPIHQSIIEFRFIPQLKDKLELKQELAEMINGQYPTQQVLAQRSVQFQIGPNSKPPTMLDVGSVLICRSEDENSFVSITNGYIAFTYERKYLGWEVFSDEALKIWQLYQSKISATNITRLGVRFINHLSVPQLDFDFDEYLVNGPKVPLNVPQIVDNFTHRTTLYNPDIECFANYVHDFHPSEKPLILLDIDVYTTKPIAVVIENVKGKLDEIRLYKNDLFFGSLTQQAIDLYK